MSAPFSFGAALGGNVRDWPALTTLEPVLPFLFHLNGEPYTLKNHFYFSALYRSRAPESRVLKMARQVGKSTFLITSGLGRCAVMPGYTALYVSPLGGQSRRLALDTAKPLVENGPFRHLMVDESCEQSISRRSFRNGSSISFTYAYLSASRVRGVARVWELWFDEFQDSFMEHVPVIAETMSAAPDPWGVIVQAGTPRGLDNPVEEVWKGSSMAEWATKCLQAGCGHWNLASVDHDLLAMIGPARDDISAGSPGVVCARCRKPLDPSRGAWAHRFPERRWSAQGYHLPQVVSPNHYASRVKWSRLIGKMNGASNYTQRRFWNEVLGESLDTGAKLVTLTEINAAACLPWANAPDELPARFAEMRPRYLWFVLAIDWGGGGGAAPQTDEGGDRAGRTRTSFTSVALLGARPDGTTDCLWGKRLLLTNDHLAEAEQVLAIARAARVDAIVHDFGGAGALRETFLRMSGWPAERTIGVVYVHSPQGPLMKYVSPRDSHDVRAHHRADRSRTLLMMIGAIKTGKLRFFQPDHASSGKSGLLQDFLALTEDKVEGGGGQERYLIRRAPAMSDDFAHAVNIGCATLWHRHGWPDMSGPRSDA